MIFPGDKICDTANNANANINNNERHRGSQYPEWAKSLRLKNSISTSNLLSIKSEFEKLYIDHSMDAFLLSEKQVKHPKTTVFSQQI